MNDIEQTPFLTRGGDFVRPDVEPTDYHAPRYEPEAEWEEGLPWWPFALGAVVVVLAVVWVLA